MLPQSPPLSLPYVDISDLSRSPSTQPQDSSALSRQKSTTGVGLIASPRTFPTDGPLREDPLPPDGPITVPPPHTGSTAWGKERAPFALGERWPSAVWLGAPGSQLRPRVRGRDAGTNNLLPHSHTRGSTDITRRGQSSQANIDRRRIIRRVFRAQRRRHTCT